MNNCSRTCVTIVMWPTSSLASISASAVAVGLALVAHSSAVQPSCISSSTGVRPVEANKMSKSLYLLHNDVRSRIHQQLHEGWETLKSHRHQRRGAVLRTYDTRAVGFTYLTPHIRRRTSLSPLILAPALINASTAGTHPALHAQVSTVRPLCNNSDCVSVVQVLRRTKLCPCLFLRVNISTSFDERVQHVSVARYGRPDKAGRVVLG
jgi:hypothetical protein